MFRPSIVLPVLCVLAFPHALVASDWPSWRGPNHNSVVLEQGFPTKWSEGSNVAWKVEIPGWGTSTPCIVGDSIFLSYCDDQNNGVICLSPDGERKWTKMLGTAAQNRNQKASGANPSPISDGQHVWVYYRSGEVACLDLDGNVVWNVNVQQKYEPDRHQWDLGTSPVLTKDCVVIAVMHQGPSYIVALNRKTGEEVWKTDRNMGAPRESRDSYTTPLVVEENGQEVVIALGADSVTAHNAATGSEIWRVGGLNPRGEGNLRQIASPVVMDGFVYAPYRRGRTLTAIRLGGSGDVTQTHVAWHLESGSTDVPTPIGYQGKLYLCTDRGEVICLDAKTGNELWTERLPRGNLPFSSSPVIVDDKIYCTREDGTTYVVQLGDEPKLLSTNALNEFAYATPAFAGGKIYLRTSDYLICIGQ